MRISSKQPLSFSELKREDRLIPFIILALVLEELIPVIALYAPFMLPSTCILPGQRTRMTEKLTQKAIASALESQHILDNIRKKAVDGKLPSSALRGTGSAVVLCRCV